VQIAANDELVKSLNTIIDSTREGTMPTLEKEGELTLAHFIGVPLDGSITLQDGKTYTWDDLLDQVKFNEMAKLIGQTYHATAAMKSVGKPATKDENGPQGITATLTGGSSSTSYTSEDVMAASFDPAIAEAVGRSMGNDCLMANRKAYSGIYGPGANIHRTPYSGRNFEYYSEDPFVSGKTCAAETAGIQSKGVYVYNKHFVMNDQENNRAGIGTWITEQALRENYLRAFELPIVYADAKCVMTGYNRLGVNWCGAYSELLLNWLRGEAGMDGFAVSDMYDSSYMVPVHEIVAGNDIPDGELDASSLAPYAPNGSKPNAAVAQAMRTSAKHVLYTVLHSRGMDGISQYTKVVSLTPWWQATLNVAQWTLCGLTLLSALLLVLDIARENKKKRP
jgi:beta-glucosidase